MGKANTFTIPTYSYDIHIGIMKSLELSHRQTKNYFLL